MGNTTNKDWKGYQEQLLKDTKLQSYLVPNSAKDETTTDIIRNPSCKDNFGGFLKRKINDKEIELDTAWKLYKVAVEENGSKHFVGYRPFTNPEKDTTKR